MRFAARVFSRCISFFLVIVLLLPLFSQVASAAQTSPYPSPSISPNDPRSFAIPNTEANVPRNQHTLIQGVLIEMFLAIGCQLTGIDMASPSTPCLGINPKTHQLGYGPAPQNGQPQIGGLLGTVNNAIAIMYTPTITTNDYFRYLSDNFGLTKTAFAAQKNGFDGLAPIRSMWVATRDVSYFLLILAFVFIGIGVMLRIKIDPRTVMTIQNQIPRVIIAIILITFSYAIAAVMIDLMWASTYVVINVITRAANPEIECAGHLSNYATSNLVSTPFSYANKVFVVSACDTVQNGFFDLSKGVANAITEMEMDAFLSFFNINPDSCTGVYDYLTDPGQCIFGAFIMWLTSFIWALIIFVILIITFFRIWLELLKAYAMLILYTILSPLFIVINLLPKRPLGFERWIRVFFANLAIFPASVAMIVLSSILVTTFTGRHEEAFVPPLVGNSNMTNFGVIIGFAVLLLTPQLISLIREKLGVPPVKQTAAVGAAFASGAGAVGAPVGKAWKHMNRRNPQTGAPLGIIAANRAKLAKGALSMIPGIGGKLAAQKEAMEGADGGGGRRLSKADLAVKDTRDKWERRKMRGKTQEEQEAALREHKNEKIDALNVQNKKRGLPFIDRIPEPTAPPTTGTQAPTPSVAGGGATATEGTPPAPSAPVLINITIDTPSGQHRLTGTAGQTMREVIREKLVNVPDDERDSVMAAVESSGWKDTHIEDAKNNPEVKSFLNSTPSLHQNPIT